eukprot:maker-scaffold84_size396325-snap-gene-0.21 protein:Tk09678 transcript:maker-scaffold84_size396325-snap-gene-0.21-mRNA-1 annotation:"PREDICTED: uncharacterized protein C18orf63 homolog isoform X1"
MSQALGSPWVVKSEPLGHWTELCAQVWKWDEAGLYPSFTRMMLSGRELVLLYPNMLALPLVDESPPKLWLVFPDDPDICGFPSPLPGGRPMKERLDCLGLRCHHSARDIPPEILEQCLQFTVQTRLAPVWNRVGPYFLENRYFLELPTSSFVEARLVFQASNDEIVLTLKGGRMRFMPMNLGDFEIRPNIYEEFKRRVIDCIPSHAIGISHVHVLPNLTRANIVSITRLLLPSEEISDWREMKRYWKNMYGFRLNEDREPEFYVNVAFGFRKTQIFSYPDLCVRPHIPYPLPRVEPEPILTRFMKDLEVRMPNVCQIPLKFISQRSQKNGNQFLAASSSFKEDFTVFGSPAPILGPQRIDVFDDLASEFQTEFPTPRRIESHTSGIETASNRIETHQGFNQSNTKPLEVNQRGLERESVQWSQPSQSQPLPLSVPVKDPAATQRSASKFDEIFKSASRGGEVQARTSSLAKPPTSSGDGVQMACPSQGSIVGKFLKSQRGIEVGTNPKAPSARLGVISSSQSFKRKSSSGASNWVPPEKKRKDAVLPSGNDTLRVIDQWKKKHNINSDEDGAQPSQQEPKTSDPSEVRMTINASLLDDLGGLETRFSGRYKSAAFKLAHDNTKTAGTYGMGDLCAYILETAGSSTRDVRAKGRQQCRIQDTRNLQAERQSGYGSQSAPIRNILARLSRLWPLSKPLLPPVPNEEKEEAVKEALKKHCEEVRQFASEAPKYLQSNSCSFWR